MLFFSPRKVIHACIFFLCYFRVSFKDPDNAKVVDRLIKEVQGANPEFQSGLIRGLLDISRSVLMFCQYTVVL